MNGNLGSTPALRDYHAIEHFCDAGKEHHPDLIVMDIQLPDVSGLEITKRLRADENLKAIPVIAVTEFAMVGDEDKIFKSGCDAYVPKPISVPKFLQTVEGLFAEKRA